MEQQPGEMGRKEIKMMNILTATGFLCSRGVVEARPDS